ncbi:MAG: CoA transferase [Candidatus Dadabacteria bacterium]|nr:MAG: CoA transferase [Candidatus Dadabacteria bacterium]
MSGASNGPLAGFRVVDASAVISGPLATMMLADQGADVIKVEAPGVGDPTRLLGATRGGITSLYLNCNRGKRAIVVNLRHELGRGVLSRLIQTADVFVQNFRPGVAERMGFGYEAVRELAPEIVYVSISGFGESGPLARSKVYDNVVQALSGMPAAQADPETGRPELVRNLVVDKATAYTVAQAVTAALLARERGAGGQHVRVSMLDVALAFFWPDGMMNHTLLAPDALRIPPIGTIYRVYRAADGYITLAGLTDEEWAGVCRAIEREDLIEDPRFASAFARLSNMNALREVLAETLATRPVADWCERLAAHDVAHAPVLDFEEVHAHPQVQASEALLEREHPSAGPLREARPAARFSATPAPGGPPAPQPGEHTDAVLAELGYGGEEIRRLREAGAVA